MDVYVVYVSSSDGYYPLTSCRTPKLAETYREGLAELPAGHPMHAPLSSTFVDELPVLSELPFGLRPPVKEERNPVMLGGFSCLALACAVSAAVLIIEGRNQMGAVVGGLAGLCVLLVAAYWRS